MNYFKHFGGLELFSTLTILLNTSPDSSTLK
uniref:Uncharacterized protein n=1 Tax=Arundo donax TaxID=35708 RepID=A0A0A8Y783_ARUDO